VTGGTVLAAAAASSVVTLWPATNAGSAADQLTAAARSNAQSAWPGASSGNSAAPELLAQMPDVAQRRQESLVLIAAQAAARRAAARKLAAEQAAAAARQQAAEQQQEAQQQQQAQAAADPAPAAQPSGSAQQIAEGMLASYGWSSSQFSCLDSLWNEESGWNVTATNPSSGAYGIPQALPGSKMASAGPDWQTDAATQISWGLSYIQGQYGSPCGAWAHEEADGWY
jgi:pyruvate/2-oxoglutarate dehydrogenase complex dihydrolipoamide acyltransferase (E2) component